MKYRLGVVLLLVLVALMALSLTSLVVSESLRFSERMNGNSSEFLTAMTRARLAVKLGETRLRDKPQSFSLMAGIPRVPGQYPALLFYRGQPSSVWQALDRQQAWSDSRRLVALEGLTGSGFLLVKHTQFVATAEGDETANFEIIARGVGPAGYGEVLLSSHYRVLATMDAPSWRLERISWQQLR